MSDLEPGAQFGPYRIEYELGRGGMSIVYLAVEDSLARTIALKIMAGHLQVDDSYRKRFNTEARAAAAISHPNIVPIYGFGEQADRLYIAMQYIEGTDFRKYLEARGPLDPMAAAAIVEQAAYALDAIHARGMTHRDIKPDNILLAEVNRGTPHVYVADFGLTRAEGDEHLTSTGQILGTVTYAAPEQLLGEPVDGRADIYSLACVLFQAVTGTPPFVRNGSTAVIYAHVTEDRPSARERNPALPPAIDDVLKKGLAKSRDERYRTASELIADFRLASEQPTAPPPILPASTDTIAPLPHSGMDPSSQAAIGSTVAQPTSDPSYASIPQPTPAAAPTFVPDPSFVGATPPPLTPPSRAISSPGPPLAGGPNPPAPAGRRRGPLIAIITVAVVVVLALVAGAIVVGGRRSQDIVTSATSPPGPSTGASPSARGSNATDASGSESPSTETTGSETTTTLNPELVKVLTVIDAQLNELKRLRSRLDATYSGLAENCKITPADAVKRIESALEDYTNVVETLKPLESSGNNDGEDLANDLRVAVERSVTVERQRREWLLNAISQNPDTSPPGCPGSGPPTDDNQVNAEADNVQALSLKSDFANRYNSIAPNSIDPSDI